MIFRTYRNPVRFLYKGVYVLAITKLMHMKEAVGVPHRHLANAIQYILDEKIMRRKQSMDYTWEAMPDMTAVRF